MPVRVVTPPASEPVSIAEACGALRIDGDELNFEVERLISSARRAIENEMAHALLEQTLELVLDDFPVCGYAIVLPRATPLQSIVIVTYRDSDGTTHTMPEADYIADTDSQPGRLVLAYDASWPSFTPYPTGAVRIQYICGAPLTSPVEPFPANLKQAILLLVRDQLDHPGEGPGSAGYEASLRRAMAHLVGGEQRVWAF